MTAENSSAAVAGEGDALVRVEQGPEWLVDLLYAPPEWVAWTLRGSVLVLAVLVAYGLYRVDVDAELVHEWLESLAVIGSIAGVTWALTASGTLPYWADVVGGVGGGVVLSQAIVRYGGLEDLAVAVTNGTSR